MRLRKIDPERIPALVAQGLSAAEIADKLGCAEGSLRVRCSQLKISLKRQGNAQPDARTDDVGPASSDAAVDRNPVAKRTDSAGKSSREPGNRTLCCPPAQDHPPTSTARCVDGHFGSDARG